MNIRKRNGAEAPYKRQKIERVIRLAFESVGQSAEPADVLAHKVEERLELAGGAVAVERIQDLVEEVLMVGGHYEAARSFIVYRNERRHKRAARAALLVYFAGNPELDHVLKELQQEFDGELYPLSQLTVKFRNLFRQGMANAAALGVLTRAAAELTSRDAPQWEQIAARIRLLSFHEQVQTYERAHSLNSLYDKLLHLTQEGLYGPYITESYTKAEIDNFEQILHPERDKLLNYSGLEILTGRYLIRTREGEIPETPQEMFLGIALHLAMNEGEQRSYWVQQFYDMLSTLKVTMATPTLANARKPFHHHLVSSTPYRTAWKASTAVSTILHK